MVELDLDPRPAEAEATEAVPVVDPGKDSVVILLTLEATPVVDL